jgi:nitronate monooxygenase
MFETRVTEMLGIKYPIIGGTMAAITDADFVAARELARCTTYQR